MPACFREQGGTCSSDVRALSNGSAAKELTREGHMPKPLPLPSQEISQRLPGVLMLSWVSKAAVRVMIPAPVQHLLRTTQL
jgi:hypothetical protein